MTLKRHSINWAIEFIDRHSDGDIFPPIPEVSVVRAHPEKLVDALVKEPLGNIHPQPFRRFIVQNEDLSYRQATQLHPQDSILLTAIVYQYGREIERQRLPKDTVFSYRFEPVADSGLYGRDRLWNEFWSSGSRKCRAYTHVIYCDIADFYNQINHHVVENQLIESGLPNQATKWILKLLKSTTAGVSRGLPIGPHAVHLIAECTLVPIDNSLRANGIEFIRYADDFLIFCSSENAARHALQTMATTLDKQQRLMLQRHKTKVFTSDDFREYCERMIEDRPINDNEKDVLQIIRKYSGGNPYASLTYNQIAPQDWQAFSAETVSGIVMEYLRTDPVDFVRLRWFYRRLAQIGHPGALEVTIENIKSLAPCLPSICTYICSIQSVPLDEWRTLGEELIGLLESDPIFENEFARLSMLSLFSRNEYIDHFVRLAGRFGTGDSHTRREILLAARANSEVDWLREHKESYGSMDPWQQLAFIYSVSKWPKDERTYFLNRHEYKSHFNRQLMQLSKDGV